MRFFVDEYRAVVPINVTSRRLRALVYPDIGDRTHQFQSSRRSDSLHPMRQFLNRFRKALVRFIVRKPSYNGLTAVEYEAVCLIAYEGREAYARAREQASYCRSMGSPSGTIFWTQVAAELARRTNMARLGKFRASPG
jgi:hypothetical protein